MNKKYNKIIYNIFILMPIIDTLNGIFIKSDTTINIGQIYRIISIIILIAIASKLSKKYLNNIIVIICFFIALNLSYYYYNNNIISIFKDLLSNSKLLMIFVFYYSFKVIYKCNKVDKYIIDCIMEKLLVIYPLTILIPYIFNIGLSVYSNGAGYKGFYNANNDLSIVFLILVLFSINKFIFDKNMKSIIILLLNIISLLLTGSKTGIIGIIILLIFYSKNFIKNIILNKKSIIFILLILFIGYYSLDHINNIFIKIQERMLYFYNLNNNFITLILSNRNTYLIESINDFINMKHKVIPLLFGTGTYYRCNSWTVGKVIEMDFFDILFSNGLIVLTICIFILICVYKERCKQKNIFDYNIAFIIMLILSFIVGHVFYSAMCGTMLALIMSGLIKKDNSYEDKKNS